MSPVFADNEQASRILSLVLRVQNSIARTLRESPTRFKPLLYHSEDTVKGDKAPPEASAWCEGYMTGVLLREAEWEPLYAQEDARDWMLPIEALAYGDHDPEYLDWVDSEEKRQGMIDELPIAAVLIYRYLAGAQPARVRESRRTARAAAGNLAQGPPAAALTAPAAARASVPRAASITHLLVQRHVDYLDAI